MYRYKDTARDVRSLFNFAMFKFKVYGRAMVAQVYSLA